MKTITSILLGLLFISAGAIAQDVTTVEAKSADISDNLDLEAVASVFAESEDLEDFENRLNDPETKISNLDINEDGYVDYLRVVENAERDAHLITIQAVLAKDMFQDVATIEVDKDEQGNERVQVVGDVYMYGNNYIIEPIYVQRPVIYSWFWGPRWRRWQSPYYYGYYPRRWNYWAPCSTYAYWGYIPNRIHVYHQFNYVNVRWSANCVRLNNRFRRADWAVHRPYSSFAYRQVGHTNRKDLVTSRGENFRPTGTAVTRNGVAPSTRTSATKNGQTTNTTRPTNASSTATKGGQTSTNTRQRVDSDWKPTAVREGRTSAVKDNKVVVTRNSKGEATKGSSTRSTSSTRSETNSSSRGTASSPERRITTGSSTRTSGTSSKKESRSTAPSTRSSSKSSTPSKASRSSSSKPSSTRSSSSRASSSKGTSSRSSSKASSGSSRSSSSKSSASSSRSSSSKGSSSKSSGSSKSSSSKSKR